MKRKKGISIRKRLLLSYLILVIIIFFVGGISIYNLHEVYRNGRKIYEVNLRSVDYLKSISQNLREIDRSLVIITTTDDKETEKKAENDISAAWADTQDLTSRYDKIRASDMEKRRFQQCKLSMMTFQKQITEIMSLLKSSDREMAVVTYQQEFEPTKATTFELIDAMVELAVKSAEKRNTENATIYGHILITIFSIVAAALIAAVIIALVISTLVEKRLDTIQDLAKRLSEYDISGDIEEMTDDEFGHTMEALNDSQMIMRDIVEKIIREAEDLGENGEDISQAVEVSGDRIEGVNVKVLTTEENSDRMKRDLQVLLSRKSDDPETAAQLRRTLKDISENLNLTDEIRGEISSVSTYLSQIQITADAQKELLNRHLEQVQKFKVS